MHTPTTRKELKEFLECERKKYGRKSTRRPVFEIGEKRILWKYVHTLRHAEYHYNSKHKAAYFIYRILLSRLQTHYGIKIPINVFSKGLHIVHLGNILVNADAVVGENCSIHVNTSIVAGGRDNGVPTIGDNCVICVGAVVLGKIHIADNCIIGANALVNKTFEENNISIAGNPAKKISDNGRQTWNSGLRSEEE